MRATFAPLTNLPRRVRPRVLSQSSESESEHDEDDRHLVPVGDVIGAAHSGLRREFVALSEFVFDLQNGARVRSALVCSENESRVGNPRLQSRAISLSM